MNSVESPQNADTTASAAEESSFGDVLRQFEEEHQAHPGAAVALEGTVVTVNEDAIVVDVGRKMEGILQPGSPGVPAGLQPGTRMMVNITGRTDDGYYMLTTIKVEQPRDFSALQAAHDEKRIVAGLVTDSVKGGLRVDVGMPAFLPASRSGIREMADLEKLVGQHIQVRITKLDVSNPDRPDIVVDRRSVLEEEANKAKSEAFASLQEGVILQGKVRSLTDFGAFVEITPGVDGLLHVSDMSWQKVDKPSSVLTVGQVIEVKVLKINPNSRKISLGLKQLMPDPWTQALENLKVGERVRGKVVRMTDFGAFVEIAPGVDGLIHLSEMSWTKRIRKPSDILKQDEQVEAVILGIQPAEKRIALGLKQALGNPWEDAATRFAVGTIVEAPVTNLAQFGAFVDLGDGIEGMIHISDIQRDKRIQHPKEVLTAGQTVKAQVLEVDTEKRRIRLGMKQLEPTPIDIYVGEHQLGEEITGRVIDADRTSARVELGEGVHGRCKLKVAEAPVAAATPVTDGSLDDLTALLLDRWKGGGSTAKSSGASSGEPSVKSGQIRKFRILAMDAANRRIELELAD